MSILFLSNITAHNHLHARRIRKTSVPRVLEEEIIANGHPVTVGDGTVRLPRTEDLIIMKAVAHRPKDIGDIEGLIEAAGQVDWEHVNHWTRQFAATLEAPEIQDIIDTLRKRGA